jgi:N-acetyl-alpha-D-muramate 1-phosphate uridylyltransferase
MYPVAILAGGLASRMRPRTDVMPKALLPVAGLPFVAHQLALLRSQGIDRVVLCVGHLGEQIRDTVGDGGAWGLSVQYSWDGPRLLGTGGAIRRALPLLGRAFFVMYGDSYLPCDFAAVERAFDAAGQHGLMTVYHNEGRYGASNVEFAGGRIARYDKTATDDAVRHIDYGLSVLTAEALSRYASDEPLDLVQVFQDLLAQRQLSGFEVDQRFYEIGSSEGLREAEAFIAGRRHDDAQ